MRPRVGARGEPPEPQRLLGEVDLAPPRPEQRLVAGGEVADVAAVLALVDPPAPQPLERAVGDADGFGGEDADLEDDGLAPDPRVGLDEEGPLDDEVLGDET